MKQRHPDWLKTGIPSGKKYHTLKSLLRRSNLNTVCEEAKCPNVAECYGRGTATFLIMGDVCTRQCRYCNIHTGVPGELDRNEPRRIAEAVCNLNLNHAVITSVTRDDLPDQGAEQFYRTVREIRKRQPECRVEILTPDFRGDLQLLEIVLASSPYIFNHNIEVVRKLFPRVRPEGSYKLSLKVLQHAASRLQFVKSGLIIGLGETKSEILETLQDLRSSGVGILTIGQYLQPRRDSAEVKKYYTIQEFDEFKIEALKMGFTHVSSAPLVRSSYHAESFSRPGQVTIKWIA